MFGWIQGPPRMILGLWYCSTYIISTSGKDIPRHFPQKELELPFFWVSQIGIIGSWWTRGSRPKSSPRWHLQGQVWRSVEKKTCCRRKGVGSQLLPRFSCAEAQFKGSQDFLSHIQDLLSHISHQSVHFTPISLEDLRFRGSNSFVGIRSGSSWATITTIQGCRLTKIAGFAMSSPTKWMARN